MIYEVNPAGRADPVPDTEIPEDEPEPTAAPEPLPGLRSLEDMRAPWADYPPEEPR